MKASNKNVLMLMFILSFLLLTMSCPSLSMAAKTDKKAKTLSANDWAAQPRASYDVSKMPDFSDYEPSSIVSPTGDTIKIAVVAAFSGPAAVNGQQWWHTTQWVAYDINKRGGIYVDGKKKLVEVIKADHMSRPDQCKKICERMAIQEKVHAFIGTDGSHFMRVINETAKKYKIIAVNIACLSDDLMDASNFNRYAFQTTYSTEQVGRAFAYYYGQIRKKEAKFYVLNQDYSFGRQLADGLKKGLKEYYPHAQIVGEDYHKLFLTDFAPYLEKIKASDAEVIFSGDWEPDSSNLIKQARQMGIKLPVAQIYMDSPRLLNELGIEGAQGMTYLSAFWIANPQFKTSAFTKMYKAWMDGWKNRWKPPYNSMQYGIFGGGYGVYTLGPYWLLSVIQRAQSTDPEKIIQVWEGDTYRMINGKVVKMRACDHKIIQDLSISEFVPPDQQKQSFNIPPYYWYKDTAAYGPVGVIPAAKVLPWMDQKLDRCSGKNGWGE